MGAALRQDAWLGRADIESVPDALSPAAYVQRAYLFTRSHNGRMPDWARKYGRGEWRFRKDYVEADARANARTLSVSDAARMLGASRRAVQNWVDEGSVPLLDGDRHADGQTRRIERKSFLTRLAEFRDRLLRSPTHRQSAAGEADKASAAQALEQRLQAATTAAAPSRAATDRATFVRRTAASVEEQLTEAATGMTPRMEQEVRAVAGRIQNDLFDGHIARVEALFHFNQISARMGVPREDARRIRREFFGR